MLGSLIERIERALFPRAAMMAATLSLLVACAAFVPPLFSVDAQMRDGFNQVYGHDFALFWNAGRIGQEETPAAIWQQGHLPDALARRLPDHTVSPETRFHYPPAILLILAPLAALPLTLAFPLMSAGGVMLLLAAVARIIPDRRMVAMTLGAPAIIGALLYGQWSLWLAGLLGFALWPVARGRAPHPFAMACFIVKPTLALALPLGFFHARHGFKMFLCAGLCTLGLVALSAWLFGLQAWQNYAAALPESRHILMEQLQSFITHSTTFGSALQMLGLPPAASRIGQWLFTACVVLAMWRMMRSRARGDLKAATLGAGTVLAAPYMMAYDLALLVPAAAFLIRDGMRHGFRRGDRLALTAMATLPCFVNLIQESSAIPIGFAMALAFFALVSTRAIGSIAEDESGARSNQQEADSMVPAERLLQHEH